MKMKSILQFLAPTLILATVMALVMGCTPMDHTNPYDPANSTTQSPNKVGFTISNNVTDIGSTTASITWNRNTEPEFYAYLVLRDTSDPGVPSAITSDMQAELMATNARDVGALLGASAVSAVFPKTTAGLKAIAFLPDANLTSFDDSGLAESTVYHYRILTLTKNLKTFAVSTNIRLETTPDKFGPNAFFYYVYSPYNLDTSRVIFDVDYDGTTGYLWIAGSARGLRMSYGLTNTYNGDEYFVAGSYVTDPTINLENSNNLLFLSGHPGNTLSPARLRGLACDGYGTVYVGAIRNYSGSTGSGYVISVSNATNWLGLQQGAGSIVLSNNKYYDSSQFKFGEWSSAFVEYGGYIFFYRDVSGYDGLHYFPVDTTNQISYFNLGNDTNDLVAGIAFDDNGLAYTTSLKDNTIRKYNTTTLTRQWIRGGAGTKPGQFSEIADIAYYKNGARERIYVADPVNNRLTVYDEEGNLITWIDTVRTFGREGVGPRGLKVYGNTLFMTVELGIVRFDL